MKKRLLGLVMTGIMVCSMLTGCGSKGTDSAKGEVNVFVWTEYVSDSAFSGFEASNPLNAESETYSVHTNTFTSPFALSVPLLPHPVSMEHTMIPVITRPNNLFFIIFSSFSKLLTYFLFKQIPLRQ